METKQTAQGLIQEAYEKLKTPDALGALALLEEALKLDFDNPELKYALKCLYWWLEQTKNLEDFQNPYERGGFFLSRLRHYHSFLEHLDGVYEECRYAIRRFVFLSALRYFEDLLGEGRNQYDPGLLLQVGRCYKGLGNYDEALKYLEQAARFKREDSETLAELADLKALLAEHRAAKALFREAFFLDPAKIDISSMESELIRRLRDKVEARGRRGAELCEWIPVYGCLWGVFSVKRELKQIEAGRLKQSIFSLETEFRGGEGKNPFLKPRLLNRYFWLIDHYENTRSDPGLIEETLLKIKVTDPEIYEQYIK